MTAFIWQHKVAWLVGIVLCALLSDQATKTWAEGALSEERTRTVQRVVEEDGVKKTVQEQVTRREAARDLAVIDGWFNFRYAKNEAAAFSLTQGIDHGFRRPMLLLIALVACSALVTWYLRLRVPDGLLMTAFALIVGGALGNFTDRLRLSYVIDFLDFYVSAPAGLVAWLNARHELLGISFRLGTHWPTFNIADICIVSGALGVILRTLRPLPGQSHGQSLTASALTTTPAQAPSSADPAAQTAPTSSSASPAA